jgi:hypothetical protein
MKTFLSYISEGGEPDRQRLIADAKKAIASAGRILPRLRTKLKSLQRGELTDEGDEPSLGVTAMSDRIADIEWNFVTMQKLVAGGPQSRTDWWEALRQATAKLNSSLRTRGKSSARMEQVSEPRGSSAKSKSNPNRRKPAVANSGVSAAAKRKLEREHRMKEKVNPSGFGVTQHAVGHDEHDVAIDDIPVEQQRELERIRSKVWGVSTGAKPPELWAAGEGIPADKGYSYISVKAMRRPQEENHMDHWLRIQDIEIEGQEQGRFPPLAFGRIDHARKLVSVTSFDKKNLRAFGSSAMNKIWAELKKRFPNYTVVELKWSG